MQTRHPDHIQPGERLADGAAHDQHHSCWTRRHFLQSLGGLTAGAALSLGGVPVRALARSPLLQKLSRAATGRVLVLVQLNGGNDGLNTVIPITNDLYYNARPGIAIPSGSTIPISTDVGLHPSLAPLEATFGDGDMAVVQGVGYPAPTLSHFRSTDVWLTASPSDNIGATGWSGRHLDALYPSFVDSPPNSPLAVQIGSGSPLLFQGPAANMGMSLFSVDLFRRIAETGKFYDEDNVPATLQGNELAFVRSVANDSYRYAASIKTASDAASNEVAYPGTSLSQNLAIVAQLIKGRLGSSIYHVSLSGFDTHANQLSRHASLMDTLSQAIDAFLQDIQAGGMENEVLVMTFSEFGRRVFQNGSAGTDHGTAAPMFLFGKGVNGGMYGALPSLSDLDNASNMIHTTDFRSIYASVLTDWFGLSATDVSDVLGGAFPLLQLVSEPTGVHRDEPVAPESFTLEQNYPNPFNPSTRITFRLEKSGHVRLSVYDLTGRRVRVLVDRTLTTGRHDVQFEAADLPSGQYVYRLQVDGRTVSKTLTLLK